MDQNSIIIQKEDILFLIEVIEELGLAADECNCDRLWPNEEPPENMRNRCLCCKTDKAHSLLLEYKSRSV